MPSCSFFGCSNSNKNTTNVSFFSFPKDNEISKIWVNKCKRVDEINLKNARICSLHFESECFQKTKQQQMLNYSPKKCRKIKPDAVPTLLLFDKPTESLQSVEDRRERANKRARKSLIKDLIQETSENSANLMDSVFIPAPTSVKDCISQECTLLMQQEINNLTKINGEYQAVIQTLIQEKEELRNKNTNLVKDQEKLKEMINALNKFFTKGQLNMILGNKKKIKWDPEDIASAISLRNVSPKAYRYLKVKLNYPLPDFSTLRRWAANLNTDEGLLMDFVTLMKAKAKNLSAIDRITVLTYDEMYTSEKMWFDSCKEQILGPCKSVQVIMARSLFGQWKQPIYYKFDQNMNTVILKNTIINLETAGFYVISVISDMGGSNLSIWRDFAITPAKPYFSNPYDLSRNIYVIADVPHLIKLLRNHFIDHGFLLANDKQVTKKYIEELLILQSLDLKLAFKIIRLHLTVSGSLRQKVKLATQLFSNTTAKAIEFCGEKKKLSNGWEETAEFIQTVNDWFDVCNSSSKYGSHEGLNCYGVNIDKQQQRLHKMNELVLGMRQIAKNTKKKSMLPFQNGILVTNTALKMLYEDVCQRFGVKYIITRRINQDILEKFFSYLRAMGGNEYPSPYEVKHRVKWYILGKHSEAVFSVNKNTEDTTCDTNLTGLSSLNNVNQYRSELPEEQDLKCSSSTLLFGLIDKTPTEIENFDDIEVITENIINAHGLRYLAGYVAHRYIAKYPSLNLGTKTKELSTTSGDSWICKFSRGHLTEPSNELMVIAQDMEQKFIGLHGEFFGKNPFVIKRIVNVLKSKYKDFPEDILQCLVRSRTHIRIKQFMLHLKGMDISDRTKLCKKMRKITST